MRAKKIKPPEPPMPRWSIQDTGSSVVAGLDLSLRGAGVAVLFPNGRIETRTFGYALSAQATERQRLDRVLYLTNSIMSFLRQRGVRYVGVENYAFAQVQGKLTMQADLGGNVKVQIYVGLKTIPLVIPSTSVRKFLLGKSTSDKAVVEKYLRFLGYDSPETNDEFDALAVALVVDCWANRRSVLTADHHLELMARLDHQVSNPAGMIKTNAVSRTARPQRSRRVG